MSLNEGEAERLIAMMKVYNEGTKALKEVFVRRENQHKQKETMMYKNAGIKSKKEAAQRLINGEVFYCGGFKLSFDHTCTNPFRVGDEPLEGIWRMYEEWRTKTEWHESLGEGRLCWVWDHEKDRGTRIAIVVCYEADRPCGFSAKEEVWWKYAEPLTKEELAKYSGERDE